MSRTENIFADVFQSTLPQGKWLTGSADCRTGGLFQSTLPQGKWPNTLYIKDIASWFQSTLPQGKWPDGNQDSSFHHAVSIHTSAREVTYFALRTFIFSYCFNPHFRKGSDQEQGHFIIEGLLFQSTLPQGKWRHQASSYTLYSQFQSTLPQGKWHKPRFGVWPFNHCFNPHFRKGSDNNVYNPSQWDKKFQSTLPQGKWHATTATTTSAIFVSIHTSAREVT